MIGDVARNLRGGSGLRHSLVEVIHPLPPTIRLNVNRSRRPVFVPLSSLSSLPSWFDSTVGILLTLAPSRKDLCTKLASSEFALLRLPPNVLSSKSRKEASRSAVAAYKCTLPTSVASSDHARAYALSRKALHRASRRFNSSEDTRCAGSRKIAPPGVVNERGTKRTEGAIFDAAPYASLIHPVSFVCDLVLCVKVLLIV